MCISDTFGFPSRERGTSVSLIEAFSNSTWCLHSVFTIIIAHNLTHTHTPQEQAQAQARAQARMHKVKATMTCT